MKLATFESNGSDRIGIAAAGEELRLTDVTSVEGVPADLMGVIATGESLRRVLARFDGRPREADDRAVSLESVRLRPPLRRPGKLLCLAGNYREHIAESGYEVLAEADVITPQFFLKPSTTLIFRVPEIIEGASSIMTLEPGDIISTGTPVGAGIGGAAVLTDGDEIVCEVEGIGRLANRARRVA